MSPENTFLLISNLIGGVTIGAFCGLIALIVGIANKKTALGIVGMAVSVVFGAIMTTVFHLPAFLSVIPSAIIAVIILVLTKRKKR